MRYGYGFHHDHWMGFGLIAPLVFLIFLGLCVGVALLVLRKTSFSGHPAGPAFEARETPEEVLDRRFALGEIDAETHASARQQLKDHPR